MQRSHSPVFSPRSDIRIPGEFEKQEYIVIGCGQLLQNYPQTFVELIRLLHGRVAIVGVARPSVIKLGEVLLAMSGLPADAVHFVPLRTSSMWVRDYSPLGAIDRKGRRVFLKFRHDHMRNRDDVGMAELFQKHFPGSSRQIDLHLEGGNLLSNGAGFALSSKTILSQNSTRGGHSVIADALERNAGMLQWACTNPLNGERTGHIDLLATFLSPTLVCIGKVDARDDENNAEMLDDLAKALADYQTSAGKLTVVRAPMPYSGDTYFRSYQNVIFANGLLIVPSYPGVDPRQANLVRDLYSEWMPDWEVRLLNCEEVSKKGGSLHCLSMNIPAEVPVPDGPRRLEVPPAKQVLPQ